VSKTSNHIAPALPLDIGYVPPTDTGSLCLAVDSTHIRSSGFSGCWFDGLELTARWTQRSGVWFR